MAETDWPTVSREIPGSASGDAERRARDERMDRRLANVRAQIAILDEIIDEWRAEGLLPPEEPQPRV
jgi:hypothetical protein